MKNLTDEEIEIIAERAAEKAIEKITSHVYQEIGKGVVSKFLTAVGVIVLVVLSWAYGSGWLK